HEQVQGDCIHRRGNPRSPRNHRGDRSSRRKNFEDAGSVEGGTPMSDVNLTPLGDVCTITMGQAPLGSNTNVEKIGIPLIAGAGDFAPESIRPSKYTTQTTKLAKSGAIILSIRASIGDVRVADREYCLGRGVASLEALPTIDRSYLFHVVASSNEILRSRGRGATFLQISKADIASLEIPLPPLDEQRRIADLLDRAQ